MQGAWVQSLVWVLRSHLPCSVTKKKRKNRHGGAGSRNVVRETPRLHKSVLSVSRFFSPCGLRLLGGDGDQAPGGHWTLGHSTARRLTDQLHATTQGLVTTLGLWTQSWSKTTLAGTRCFNTQIQTFLLTFVWNVSVVVLSSLVLRAWLSSSSCDPVLCSPTLRDWLVK